MKKIKPYFSVITPTYNRADLLEIPFYSLTQQTFKDFEWIIVDDGSTDDTKKIVNKFISCADFKIIYKKIKHGGKHMATRKAYDIACGKWVFELDSDDSLYNDNTLANLHDITKSTPKKFACLGGCFIDQDDNVFPKLVQDYLDLDINTYLDLFCSTTGINTLNIAWLMKLDYAKSELPPKINDNLSYFPEAVINVRRALKSKNFNLRIFNQPWYRYNMYNTDSVTVNTHQTNAQWYYAKSLIETLHQYNMIDRYHDFFMQNCKNLFNNIPANKTLYDNYKVLRMNGIQRLFPIFLLKHIVKHTFAINHNEIVLLGFKIKTRRGK